MSTSEDRRRRIDSGLTGEKVPFPDPAAAPAGADAEAGGSGNGWRDGRPPASAPPLHGPAISDESGRRIDGALTRSGSRRTTVLTMAGLVLIALLGLALGLVGLAVR